MFVKFKYEVLCFWIQTFNPFCILSFLLFFSLSKNNKISLWNEVFKHILIVFVSILENLLYIYIFVILLLLDKNLKIKQSVHSDKTGLWLSLLGHLTQCWASGFDERLVFERASFSPNYFDQKFQPVIFLRNKIFNKCCKLGHTDGHKSKWSPAIAYQILMRLEGVARKLLISLAVDV